MEAINAIFEPAVRDGRIHGVCVLGRNTKGSVNISRSYGISNVRPGSEAEQRMADDRPMRFASATKLLTCIMVLQCVERGYVSLDDTIEKLLPEVAGFNVITGYDDETGKPIERPPKSPITLQQLMSHSSGVGYAPLSPLLARYRKDQGFPVEQDSDNLDENFTFPLMFDPGEEWAYGPGLDWCTRLIARASGESAEDFLQSHMVKPLGNRPEEMTYYLLDYPEAHARHADAILAPEEGVQTSDTTSTPSYDTTVHYWDRREEPSGGQGIFCTPRSYMEVLHSILTDDGRLLKPETRKLLFEPALSPNAEASLSEKMVSWRPFHIGEPVPVTVPKSHSVGGLLLTGDCVPDDPAAWRRKGSLSWAGACNVFWNIDPAAGVCCLWAFHSKPFGIPRYMELGEAFEKAFYNMAREN